MPSDGPALFVNRVRRQTFDTPPALPVEHRAALDVFLADLVRPYGLGLHDVVHNGHSYGEMGARLIAETVGEHEPVDLLILVYAVPDMRPGRATATYLSHVCPGGPLAFALCEQGNAAAFTGMRLARDYVRSGAYKRVLLLIVEQAALPYGDAEAASIPQRHAGVAILCGLSGETKLQSLGQHPNVTAAQAAEIVAKEAGAAATLICGPELTVPESRKARDGQPFTGVWWELADQMGRGEEVLVAEYDPQLRYLSFATFI